MVKEYRFLLGSFVLALRLLVGYFNSMAPSIWRLTPLLTFALISFAQAQPAIPQNVTASDGTSTDHVLVQWSFVPLATSYEVWRSTNNNSASAVLLKTVTGTNGATDRAWPPTTTYYYFVKARNAAGASGFSAGDSGFRALVEPGGVLWSTPISSAWPAVLGPEGNIYYRSSTNLIALKPDGTTNWVFSVGEGWVSPPVVGVDGSVFCTVDTNLFAINPNGSLKWRKWTDSPQLFFKTYHQTTPDGKVLVSGNKRVMNGPTEVTADSITTYDTDGNFLWDFYPGNESPMVIDSEGRIVFFSGWNGGRLRAISKDGESLWDRNVPIGQVLALGPDGSIIYPNENKIYSVSPSGQPQWSYTLEHPGHPRMLVIGNDGTIYASTSTSSHSYITAINFDGTHKWTSHVANQNFESGFLVLGFDQKIYFNQEGNLCNFDVTSPPNDPRLVNKHNIASPVEMLMLANSGTLYTSRGTVIRAFSRPQKGGWPMYQQDIHQSGRLTSRPSLQMTKDNQKLSLSFDPDIGRDYYIQSSLDFTNWTTPMIIRSNKVDVQIGNDPTKYFRVIAE